MGLNFLHPALLLGALAACLPWLIQRLGQQRAPIVAFSAFDFLLATSCQSARQRRLKQWLLLLLRTLLVLLLALALARPIEKQTAAAQASAKHQQVAVVLDVSASMGYVWQGKTLLEHAMQQVEEKVAELGTSASVTLIVASDVARMPCGSFSPDHHALLRCMRAQTLTDKSSDLGKALQTAQGLWQAHVEETTPEVWLFSDFATNSFADIESEHVAPSIALTFVDAARRQAWQALPNVAVEDVAILVPQDAEHVLARQFDITLHNLGPQRVQARRLRLAVDGNTVLQARLEAPGRSRVHKMLSYTFETPGAHLVEVCLDASSDDGFAQDDVWRQKIYLAPLVHVLAVGDDTQTASHEDASFFMERALAQTPAGESPIALQTCHLNQLQARLEHEDPAFDVVVLLDVPSLTPAQTDALRHFVARDKGLFLTLGAATDFEVTNAQMADLLPRALRDRTSPSDPKTKQTSVGIEMLDWSHPILRGLDRNVGESLQKTHTQRYFHLETGQQDQAQTILAFAQHTPALVEQRRLQGRVLLWTSSLDLEGGDVVLSSAFVPLLQRSLRYLAHHVAPYKQLSRRVPARVALRVPSTCDAVCLKGPDARLHEGSLTTSQEAGHTTAQFAALDVAGHYQARLRCAQKWRDAPELDVVLNPSLEESDLEPIAHDRLEKIGHDWTDETVTAQLAPSALPRWSNDYGAMALLWLWGVVLLEGLLAARS